MTPKKCWKDGRPGAGTLSIFFIITARSFIVDLQGVSRVAGLLSDLYHKRTGSQPDTFCKFVPVRYALRVLYLKYLGLVQVTSCKTATQVPCKHEKSIVLCIYFGN